MNINFISRTRANFVFSIDGECENIELDGVKCKDGVVWFSRKKFNDQKECEGWFKENIHEFHKEFDPSEMQVKTLHMANSKGSGITDKEWEKIKLLMTRPEEFSKEDVVIYHPLIAHNLIDRDVQRFSLSTLKGFVKTFPDKGILIGHQHGPPGVGRIYDAKLEKKTSEEAVEIARDMPKRFQQMIPSIIEKDGSVYFVRLSFYTLKDNIEFVRNMDAGIIKDMSLGFAAGGLTAIRDEDDNTLYWEYTGEGVALEASFVWLGAQNGAQNQKNMKEEIPPVKPVKTEDKPSQDEEQGKHAAKEEITNGGTRMKLTSKSLGLEIEFDEKTIESAQDAIDTKVSEILEKVKELETDREEYAKLKAALPEGTTPESAKELVEQANARKAELVEEVIKYGSLIELIKKEDVENKRKQLNEMTIEMLVDKLKEYKVIHDQRNKGNEVLPAGDEKKDPVKDPSYRHVPQSHFEIY